jgi:hypothetical protein
LELIKNHLLIFDFHGLGSLLDAHVFAKMSEPLLNILSLLARSTLHLLCPAQSQHSSTHSLLSLRIRVRSSHFTPCLFGVTLIFIVFNFYCISYALSLTAESYLIQGNLLSPLRKDQISQLWLRLIKSDLIVLIVERSSLITHCRGSTSFGQLQNLLLLQVFRSREEGKEDLFS